jgi:hypothetical protein
MLSVTPAFRSVLLPLLCLLAGSFSIGLAQEEAAPCPEKTATTQADEELASEIRTRFARSKISKNHFKVEVRQGIAFIDGATEIVQHKGTATRLARLAGAREIVNRITVSQDARKAAAAPLEKARKKKLRIVSDKDKPR